MNAAKSLSLIAVALMLIACGEEPPASSESNVTDSSPELSLYRAGNRYGWGGQDRYIDDVQEVLAKRCATCHGCNDSPCQLKLTSLEGILRGSNETNLFSVGLFGVGKSKLAEFRVTDPDGLVNWEATEAVWRDADYYSVTAGGRESIMNQLLFAAHENPIADRDLTPAYELFQDGLATREFQCVGPDELTAEELRPRAMPFGMPELSDEDHESLTSWLTDGSPKTNREGQAQLAEPLDMATIDKWESYFNRSTPKGQLVARYLYEHLFFAHIHFPEMPGEFYELVRSSTAAPTPIQEIVTEVPHDDPGKAAPFYRLRKYTPIVVQKNHVPWQLDDKVMARWDELFFAVPYDVDLPDYEDPNPFANFHTLPARSRAQFMIENSYPLIEALVKADVCTGSRATYAIRDRFWVWFMEPSADPSAQDPRLGQEDYEQLNPGGFDMEERYQESFERELRNMHPNGLSMDAIWNGGGENPNAWLTVLRHRTSATVHQGPVNGRPETLWVLSYSNFERLYYNLVANFVVGGAGADQAATWTYMSRIRTEGEDLWLSLLPEKYRQSLRDEWTGEFGSFVLDLIQGWVEGDLYSEGRSSRVSITSDDPVGELIALGQAHMGKKIAADDPLNPDTSADPRSETAVDALPAAVDTFEDFERALSAISGWRGAHAQVFPDVTVIRVHEWNGEPRFYTVVNNRGYLNNDLIFGEDRARVPEQDVLSTMRGIAGSYPELFIDVPLGTDATIFVYDVAAVDNAADWQGVMDSYSSPEDGVHIVRRSDPEFFWPFLDGLHDWHVNNNPISAGILDISEYGW